MPWSENIVTVDSTMTKAAEILQHSSIKLVLVVDDEKRLIGTISDGDIRRAILRGVGMDGSARDIMNANPKVARLNDDRQALIDLMHEKVIRYMPVVDKNGHVVAIDSLDRLEHGDRRDNIVVLLAGGLGKRLLPLTQNCPKPMLNVGEKPILQTILEQFIRYGFHRFYISVNYLADQVTQYFGDGSRWGVSIGYIHEDKPLGTAGPLGLLPEKPTQPVLMMNGDLLTKVNFERLLEFHLDHGAAATIGVREYDFQVPFGTVEIDGHRVTSIIEKPSYSFFVNAGIYALSPEFVASVPVNTYTDMPDHLRFFTEQGKQVDAFPIHEYWLDIGRKDDFDRAQQEYEEKFR
ncbi:MAG TPA: nucleotidyltransferase family protein [Magnetospirillum sp.]|nr:nucleotidyltransferase family protein [Magnetospirillum sp.]